MNFDDWTVFALFWVLFVTTPGPNAVNCIQNGMQVGFARALWGVAAILTQASLFLTLSTLGVSTLIVASPSLFIGLQAAGAGVLIWLGVRNWRAAARPVQPASHHGHSLYVKAFLIATINAKSIMGYLAAFSQFVAIDTPLSDQVTVIFPTALTLTALSYSGYSALGAWLGRRALSAILNLWVRRCLAACFLVYGALLALSLAKSLI